MTLIKQTVTAKARKLSAEWNCEIMQDTQAQYGIDIEEEIIKSMYSTPRHCYE